MHRAFSHRESETSESLRRLEVRFSYGGTVLCAPRTTTQLECSGATRFERFLIL